MQIRAVAFDVDGTLYPNSVMYLASVPFFVSRPRLMLGFRRVRRAIREVRPIGDFYDLQARMLARELGVATEAARALIDRRIYSDAERVLSVVPRFPHVRESVERLREAGIKVGLLSDFPLGGKLRRLGLEGLWDIGLEAERVGYLKPHPEPFRAILDALGSEAAETLYVGNNYAYDVLGAGAVGMRTAHLTARPRRDSRADLSFSSYRTLASWVLGGQIR
ncbi:MAG: HAD family hydrolase [Spirochaetaceae bacterium]